VPAVELYVHALVSSGRWSAMTSKAVEDVVAALDLSGPLGLSSCCWIVQVLFRDLVIPCGRRAFDSLITGPEPGGRCSGTAAHYDRVGAL
jgi:hypothetical protein